MKFFVIILQDFYFSFINPCDRMVSGGSLVEILVEMNGWIDDTYTVYDSASSPVSHFWHVPPAAVDWCCRLYFPDQLLTGTLHQKQNKTLRQRGWRTWYRQVHLLADLGWVDFDFGSSTFCLGWWEVGRTGGVVGQWARWWSITNLSQLNPVGQEMDLTVLFIHNFLCPGNCSLGKVS